MFEIGQTANTKKINTSSIIITVSKKKFTDFTMANVNRQLQNFTNALPAFFAAEGSLSFEHYFFVSFQDSVLRILMAGRCSCGYNHMRDCCNKGYCNNILLPLFQEQFGRRYVRQVIPVLTSDQDLAVIVNGFGGTIEYPRLNVGNTNAFNLRRFIFTSHPLVDPVGRATLARRVFRLTEKALEQ